MTDKDINKLIDAGFTIIRPFNFAKVIKRRTRKGFWVNYSKTFESYPDLNQHLRELLQDPKTVQM